VNIRFVAKKSDIRNCPENITPDIKSLLRNVVQSAKREFASYFQKNIELTFELILSVAAVSCALSSIRIKNCICFVFFKLQRCEWPSWPDCLDV